MVSTKLKTPSFLTGFGSIAMSKIFDYLKPETKRLEKEVFPKLVEQRKLFGYLFAGQWFDVGNPEIYQQAVKAWR